MLSLYIVFAMMNGIKRRKNRQIRLGRTEEGIEEGINRRTTKAAPTILDTFFEILKFYA